MKYIILSLMGLCFSLTLFSQTTIDYRRFQTPVQSQGDRGTCTAFGIAAVLETFPGVPANISEQYLYGALKQSQEGRPEAEGDVLYNYIKSLGLYGFVHEEELPYDSKKANWEDAKDAMEAMYKLTGTWSVSLQLQSDNAKYYVPADQCVYGNKLQVRDPEVIKKWLRGGHKAIAVAYHYLDATWTDKSRPSKAVFHPPIEVLQNGNFVSYSAAKANEKEEGSLIHNILTNRIKKRLLPGAAYDKGHTVTIVGYNKDGFIFKNSWGADWGDNGYGYISYEAHEFMVTEALAIKAFEFKEPREKKLLSNTTDVRLKTTLHGSAQEPQLKVSLFCPSKEYDTEFKFTYYNIFDQSGNLLERRAGLIPISKMMKGIYDLSFETIVLNQTSIDQKIKDGLEPVKVIVNLGDSNNQRSRELVFPEVYFKTAEYKDAKKEEPSINQLLRVGRNKKE